MGGLLGHVVLGLVFLIIGLWHLYNQTKLHAIYHKYISPLWFPTSKLRHLELYLIMIGSSTFTFMELRHNPMDQDGTILFANLHRYEHCTMAMAFFFYALFSVVLDKVQPKGHNHVEFFLAGLAFCQELLLFHFHSTDHVGLEGQYHFLLEIVIFVSLITTISGICGRNSFFVDFIRSLSILFQGLWLIIMGIMLWTPEYIPKGCLIHQEKGREVVRCKDDESLHRAKALVNLQFCWFLTGITLSAVSFYLIMTKVYGGRVMLLVEDEEQISMLEDEEPGCLPIGEGFETINLEK